MLRAFLKHFYALTFASPYMLAQAFGKFDDGVHGVRSITLTRDPHRMVLMFCDMNHQLHLNKWQPVEGRSAMHGRHGDDMSLPITDHTHFLRFVPVFGNVHLQTFIHDFQAEGEYQEIVAHSDARVERTEQRMAVGLWDQSVLPPDGIALNANTMRSFYVPEGETAAWLVMYGDPAVVAGSPIRGYTRNKEWAPHEDFGRTMPHEAIQATLAHVLHRLGVTHLQEFPGART